MKKKVLILGVDGYLGRNLQHYLERFSPCYDVEGIDNYSRRALATSLFPLKSYNPKEDLDIAINIDSLLDLLREGFDSVVDLAEQPSAPWSMRSISNASDTLINNLCGTVNVIECIKRLATKPQLIKLGTMGEYGDWIYNNHQIPEASRLEVEWQNKPLTIPLPRWAGSYYHWSKVFDSQLLDWASKNWELSVTDLNQGPVWGSRMNGFPVVSRFDYDAEFGTVVNRFIAQAVTDYPLTVYGMGGQTRGFINLNDSMRMIKWVIDHPSEPGELRIINQITEIKTINEIARLVGESFSRLTNQRFSIDHLPNPRIEAEKHNYEVAFETTKGAIKDLKFSLEGDLTSTIQDVYELRDQINQDWFQPKVLW